VVESTITVHDSHVSQDVTEAGSAALVLMQNARRALFVDLDTSLSIADTSSGTPGAHVGSQIEISE
jgi:hypothetical protein